MRLLLSCSPFSLSPFPPRPGSPARSGRWPPRSTREADRHVALLERLVNRNSGSLNLAGVAAVGEMMRAELEPLGFEVRWIDMRETGRAGHIVATHRGPGRNVLLIGHLDTVFEPDSPFQRFTRQGNRATGPGVGDDKGGLVVIVAALRAMQQAGTLRDAEHHHRPHRRRGADRARRSPSPAAT